MTATTTPHQADTVPWTVVATIHDTLHLNLHPSGDYSIHGTFPIEPTPNLPDDHASLAATVVRATHARGGCIGGITNMSTPGKIHLVFADSTTATKVWSMFVSLAVHVAATRGA